MAGVVYVDGKREDKPGSPFREDAEVEVAEGANKYVSRGGLKLERAFEYWDVDINGKTAMDIGASTGGFTDVMLRAGAEKVFCVDVGYGQLDWKLRNDPRIVNLERTNIRYLDPSLITVPPDLITIDVSFISLRLVLPVAVAHLADGGSIITLVKPQFEAERGQVGKKGIVRDPAVRDEVIEKVKGYGADNGLVFAGLIESPITGAKGNVEFLMRFTKSDSG